MNPAASTNTSPARIESRPPHGRRARRGRECRRLRDPAGGQDRGCGTPSQDLPGSEGGPRPASTLTDRARNALHFRPGGGTGTPGPPSAPAAALNSPGAFVVVRAGGRGMRPPAHSPPQSRLSGDSSRRRGIRRQTRNPTRRQDQPVHYTSRGWGRLPETQGASMDFYGIRGTPSHVFGTGRTHTVRHPALPDPRMHETGVLCSARRWHRGRLVLGAESPSYSWTRSPASTPHCDTGSPGERVL